MPESHCAHPALLRSLLQGKWFARVSGPDANPPSIPLLRAGTSPNSFYSFPPPSPEGSLHLQREGLRESIKGRRLRLMLCFAQHPLPKLPAAVAGAVRAPSAALLPPANKPLASFKPSPNASDILRTPGTWAPPPRLASTQHTVVQYVVQLPGLRGSARSEPRTSLALGLQTWGLRSQWI